MREEWTKDLFKIEAQVFSFPDPQWESAQWDRTQAYNDTKAMLVANPDIDGVWTANDDMAMGAIQALKQAGLSGKVGERLRRNPGDI